MNAITTNAAFATRDIRLDARARDEREDERTERS